MLYIALLIKKLKQDMFYRYGTGLYTGAHRQENRSFANIRHGISEIRSDGLDPLQSSSAASLEEQSNRL
jgi:hypothetical protein